MSASLQPDGKLIAFTSDRDGGDNIWVMDRNPIENIRNSESIRFVMINGVLYDTRNMDEVYPEAKVRTKFFWER